VDGTIQIPVWFALLLVAICVLWLVQHIVFPTFRWAIRHKANAAIGEANQKLALKIPTLKLTKREVLI